MHLKTESLKLNTRPVTSVLEPASLLDNSDLYFIGIGGVGMSAVARLLKNRGYAVSGSDLLSNLATAELQHLGVEINFKQDGQSIDSGTDLIVTSAAIPENNRDLVKARGLGIRVIKYSQLLGMLMNGKKGIAVSGTHGKTTTTAMIATILKVADLDPACVIGSDSAEFGEDSSAGAGDLFVAEACEYDRTFLNLVPQMGVITNIDEDHLDYYKDVNELRSAFVEFAASICSDGVLVIDDRDCQALNGLDGLECNVESYAIADDKACCASLDRGTIRFNNRRHAASAGSLPNARRRLAWIAAPSPFREGRRQFDVRYKGSFYGTFCITVPGVHNMMNALASIAICHHAGVDIKCIQEGLAAFRGVKRRFQVIGTANGITIIDDYAHHPTAIQTTLKAARELYHDRRIWCLYQPHQHSRTRKLMERFATSFGHADKIVFTDIYSARDTLLDRETVSSADVVNKMKMSGVADVRLISASREVEDFLAAHLEHGDVLIAMGAGDVWKITANILGRLQKKEIEDNL